MLRKLWFCVGLWLIVPQSMTASQALHTALLSIEKGGGERAEGSADEEALIALIEQFAETLSLRTERFFLHSFNDIHSFSSIVTVFFPSTTLAVENSGDEIVYFFPLASSQAQLMLAFSLIDALSEKTRPTESRIVFLGAETAPLVFDEHSQRRADAYPIGTRSWLRRYSVSSNSQLFYFNLAEPTHKLVIGSSGRASSPRAVIEAAQEALHRTLFSSTLKRGGILRQKADYLAIDHYLDNNYQAVMIHSAAGDDPVVNRSTKEWAAELAGLLTRPVEQPAFNDDADRNFLIIGSRIVSEITYLWFLAVLFIFLLLIASVKRRAYRVQRRFLRRNVKHFLYLVPWVFLSLFLASFITQDSLIQQKNENLWELMPFHFFVYKIIVTLFVGSLLARLLAHVVEVHEPRFYTAAAVFFSLINVLAFASVNIVFLLPFLWFFCCVMIFSLNRILSRRLIWGFLAPIPLFVMGSIWIEPQQSLGFFDFFLFDYFAGNIVLTLVFLPIFLMSIAIMHQRTFLSLYHKHFASMEWFYGLLALSILGYILTYQPYGSHRSQPITVIAQGRFLTDYGLAEIKSPHALGDIILKINDQRQSLTLGQQRGINNVFFPLNTYVGLNGTLTHHRGRSMIQLTIQNNTNPHYLDIVLQTEERLGVVDANFPVYRVEGDETSTVLRLFIGMNPPNPLEVRITTDPLRTLRAEVYATFINPPNIIIEKEYSHLEYSVLQLKRTITL